MKTRMTRTKRAALVLLGVLMMGVGVDHFLNPTPFERIVPSWLPSPAMLVAVSGVFEVLGGVGVLVPRTRRFAAWGLVALYVAVFPANVNMAIHHIQLSPTDALPVWAMWARLPFQALFIAWAYWFTRDDVTTASPSALTSRA
jgi:uncharacterized membrane protein